MVPFNYPNNDDSKNGRIKEINKGLVLLLL